MIKYQIIDQTSKNNFKASACSLWACGRRRWRLVELLPSILFVTTHDIKVQNAWHGNLQPPPTASTARLPAPEPAIVRCNHNQAHFDPGCKGMRHFVSLFLKA